MDITEILPEEILVEIMKCCSGKDLLALTETCKLFKIIIARETKLMKKIRLRIRVDNSKRISREFLETAKMLTTERKFSTLKLELTNGKSKFKENCLVMKPIFEQLSKSVTDLEIFKSGESKLPRSTFENMLKAFLSNLQSLKIGNLYFNNQPGAKASSSNPDQNELQLKSLTIEDCDLQLLSVLHCCRHLETFGYQAYCHESTLYQHVPARTAAFLKEQRGLKVLNLSIERVGSYGPHNIGNWLDSEFFINFLEKQKQLEELTVMLAAIPSRKLMTTICELPVLKVLSLLAGIHHETFQRAADFNGISNQSVKFLTVDKHEAYGKIWEIFEGVESIEVGYRRYQNTLGVFPHQYLPMLKLSRNWFAEGARVGFIYEPTFIPEDQAAFEQNMLKFIECHSDLLRLVHIRMPDGCFKLSLKFCKSLVKLVEDADQIKIFKVDNDKKFKKFMTAKYPHVKYDLDNSLWF